MRFLIIEDDDYKVKTLMPYLSEHEVVRECSYNSGVRSLLNTDYDGIILDMGLPIFEDDHQYACDRGIMILSEMKRKCIDTPVMVYSSGRKEEFPLEQFSNVAIFVHASAFVSIDREMTHFMKIADTYQNSQAVT